MTTRAQLRKTALSFPQASEERSRPKESAFLVAGERFARVDPKGRACLRLPTARARDLSAEHPTAAIVGEGSDVEVSVPLADVNGRRLNHWVRLAWAAHAPPEPVRWLSAADTAVPGEVGDLPKEIGGPATRALVANGVTTLAQVAASSQAELSAMHGVGPKAVRVLEDALARAGLSFADPV